MGKVLNRMLINSDTHALAETALDRKAFVFGNDLFARSTLITKNSSPLLQRHRNSLGTSQGRQLASVIDFLRAGCLQIEKSKFPSCEFVCSIQNELLHQAMRKPSPVLERLFTLEMLKLFGPYLDSSLKIPDNADIDQVNFGKWREWFNKNLKGRDKNEDVAKVRLFNEKLKKAATSIINTHFVRKLNEAYIGSMDVEVGYKEWTDPIIYKSGVPFIQL